MKKIIFIIILSLCAGNMLQAQLLNKIKAKVKSAANNSVDRSTDKVIDNSINKPADNVTDTVLDKTGKKINSLLKKKKKGDPDPNTPPGSDSTAIKPAGIDSSAVAIPIRDSAATKPQNQN